MDQKELENLLDGLIGAVYTALTKNLTMPAAQEAIEIAKARAVMIIMPFLDRYEVDEDDYHSSDCDICGDPEC